MGIDGLAGVVPKDTKPEDAGSKASTIQSCLVTLCSQFCGGIHSENPPGTLVCVRCKIHYDLSAARPIYVQETLGTCPCASRIV